MAIKSSFDPSRPSVPLSFPISNLSDLESGAYFRSFHYPFNRASVLLPERAAGRLPDRRRLLVCHDMMGGYADDRWVQGGGNDGAYAIWHWYLMDVFVYFSHELVTIPPPCWTNAAHTHGVKVLGTFITEYEKGAEICRTLLATKESVRMYAEKLAELAFALGFDGWLLNMEVTLNAEQVANLEEFVGHLTQVMHSEVPGSLIIWYDSVTIDGHLDWQDQLNEKNKPFFDLCDGIFVNYTWKENNPISSAAFAGSRRYDVYMGIDVFGRGTYGGGQWNTNVALDLLKKDDVSAAIFAPGWVYENLPKADFQINQNRWWGLIKQSWGILQIYPKILPFYSNFDQGHGLHFSIKGLRLADVPWNNISCQGFQPLLEGPLNPFEEHVHSDQANLQVFINFEAESYSGGANVTCKGSFRENESFATRLFQGEVPFEDGRPVAFTYSVKSDVNSHMGLLVSFIKGYHRQLYFLADNALSNMHKLTKRFGEVCRVPVEQIRGDGPADSPWILHRSVLANEGFMLTDIYLYCYLESQDSEDAKMEELSPYSASLGHISIQYFGENAEFPSADSWIIQLQDASWVKGETGTSTMSLTLTWKLKDEKAAMPFTKYNIYVKKQETPKDHLLGVASVDRFHVSDLDVEDPGGIIDVKFTVQPSRHDGACQELDQCPAFELSIKTGPCLVGK